MLEVEYMLLIMPSKNEERHKYIQRSVLNFGLELFLRPTLLLFVVGDVMSIRSET